MPHVVFELGNLTVTQDRQARPLIPGVEPGGSRVGQPTKPALLLTGAAIVVNDISITDTAEFWLAHIDLKLSKDVDLNPGFLLDVGTIYGGVLGTAQHVSALEVNDEFQARNTIWAPAFMGVRVTLLNVASFNANIHVDYERVDIDWMEWFLRWEFLDNITDNDRDY